MKSREFIFTALTFLVVAESIAIVSVGTEDWGSFLFWTSPAAFAVGFLGPALARASVKRRNSIAFGGGLLVGLLFGFSWTVVVGTFLGAWVGAFGMPILLCWTAAGASGFFGAQVFRRNPFVRTIPIVAVVSVALSFAVFLIPLLARKVADDRELSVYLFRYTPGSASLVIDEKPRMLSGDRRSLSETDKAVLKTRYPTGLLTLETLATAGSGPFACAVVVVDRPVEVPVLLAQPDRGVVFYFQSATGFEDVPGNVSKLNRSIKLERRTYAWEGNGYISLGYLIEAWDGSATGADAMRWPVNR